MLLAGDVGGTKTLLGLFQRTSPRPRAITIRSFETAAFTSFPAILDAFVSELDMPLHVEAAAVGVAGPVIGRRARLTNIVWDIAADEIADRLSSRHVTLLNDLEAMANGVPVLADDEYVSLQDGAARADGNAAVIAAGTGLGQAYLHRVGSRLIPVSSEGGHADFAARTDREFELVRMLRELYGRAEVEHVLSGPGLLNLHRFTHRGGECPVVADLTHVDAAPRVSQSGLSGRCQFCAEALTMFATIYGAEAGNLALRGLATAGLFVGGGIAPKILPALTTGRFMETFCAKAPMTELLSRVPVRVILNPQAGLLGAAVRAAELIDGL